MAINLKQILSMLCAGTLAVTALPGMAQTVKAAPNEIEGHELVAENSNLALYLKQDNLSIIVEDKSTGNLMYSTLTQEDDDGKNNASWSGYMQSGVVLSAIKDTNDTYQVDLINDKNEITYQMNEDGFSASIDYTEYEFGLTVNVTLEDDGLVVNVPDDSIYENAEGKYIGSVSLFPFLGYSHLDDKDGYMLIPDGNGALIYLDDKEGRYSSAFSQPIYGSDAGFRDSSVTELLLDRYDTVNDQEYVIAPIFGIAHTDDEFALLGIVESGDTRANIECYPNGVTVDYNRCFARFIMRKVYKQPLNSGDTANTVTNVETDRSHHDLQIRYIFLDGDDASYSGMAVAYRNYLLDNGSLTKKNTSYQTRVDFLGTDREEFLISTRAVTMTTIEDVESIFEDLQRSGVKSVLSVYKGWQAGGIYNVPVSKYKVDGNLGKNSELSDLISKSAGNGYYMFLYDDALRINPDEQDATFNVTKMINKRRFEEEEHSNVYDTFNYLTPQRSATLVDKLVSSTQKANVNNLALAGITNTLFSYTYSSATYDRDSTAKVYEDLIANAAKNSNLILEQPFMYLLEYTDVYLDMPLGSSDYMYEDEEIPFLSMVLKGVVPMYSDYVNFEANKTEFLLQMVESGVYPSFYITKEDSSALIYTNSADLYSTQYDVYKDTIVDYDTQLSAVADKVSGSCIINHEKRDDGVTVVTYDNGVKIYVNYSNNAVTVDGITVNALSYKVGE